MGDTKGGGGRGRARGAGGTIAVTYQTAVEGGQTARIPNADNVLRLHFAGRLNDARNPGRQNTLRTQTGTLGGRSTRASEAKQWVNGFRDAYNGREGSMTRARRVSPAAIEGNRAGFRERERQFNMATR